MAVAKAIPISLIVLINISDKIIFVITLTMETYKGVLVSSLAKKQTTKTLINTYAGRPSAKKARTLEV